MEAGKAGTSSATGKQRKQVRFHASNLKLVSRSDEMSVFVPTGGTAPPPLPPPNQDVSSGIARNAASPATAPQEGQQDRRKCGRPRKYAPNDVPLLLPPPDTATPLALPVLPPPRRTVRRPTSQKQKIEAIRSAGTRTMPQIVTVKKGEDITSKLTLLAQESLHSFCVLAASGSLANATLNQPVGSGGTVTYEGQYEILSLSGSYILSGNGNQHTCTGRLSISLVGPCGVVFGGSVAGPLVAKTPVQMFLWSFVAEEVEGQEQILTPGRAPGAVTGVGSDHPSTSMGRSAPN